MSATLSIQIVAVVSPHHLAEAAGYLGAALGVAMVVPQIVRTLRNRTLAGVSALTWALTALSSLTWMLYGFRADEVPQIPGNILLVSGAVVIVLAVPSAISSWLRGAGLALAAATLVLLAFVLPPTALGFLGFGIGLVSAVPQTIESLTRPHDEASAVSIPAWALRAASQVSWLTYAIARGDLTVTISATFILASALLLVATERRRRPVPAAVPDGAVACPVG